MKSNEKAATRVDAGFFTSALVLSRGIPVGSYDVGPRKMWSYLVMLLSRYVFVVKWQRNTNDSDYSVVRNDSTTYSVVRKDSGYSVVKIDFSYSVVRINLSYLLVEHYTRDLYKVDSNSISLIRNSKSL